MGRRAAVITVAIAALHVMVTSGASGQGSGGQAGAFLRIPVGARPAGMGNAFVAIADDGNAQYFNPGGLYQIQGTRLSAMYSPMSMDRSHYMGNFVYANERLGAFGLLLVGFRVSDIDGRDSQGNPTGLFEDSELAVGIGYGRQILSFLGIGGNLKYLSHSLAHKKATGFALDVGGHSKIEIDHGLIRSIRLGISLADLGGQLSWNTTSTRKDDIPSVLRLGGGLDFTVGGGVFLLSVQASKVSNGPFIFSSGVEAWPVHALGLRAGAREGEWGFGLSVRASGLEFDYAFMPDQLEEGTINRIGIQIGL